MHELDSVIASGISSVKSACSNSRFRLLSEEDLLIRIVADLSTRLPSDLHAFAKARVDGHYRLSSELKGRLQYFDIVIASDIVEPLAGSITNHTPGAVVRPHAADISALLEVKLVGRWFDRVDLRNSIRGIEADIRKLATYTARSRDVLPGMVVFEERLIAQPRSLTLLAESGERLERIAKESHVRLYRVRID